MRPTHPALPGANLSRMVTAALLAAALAGALAAPRPLAAAAKVVGDGTPASCTRAALAAQLVGGGEIRFNCGSAPATILIDAPLDITAPATVIDGAGRVTLQGAGGRIIDHRTFGLIGSSSLTLRGLTLAGGRASGSGESPEAAYAANGAAVLSRFQAADPAFKPSLIVEDVTFRDNDSALAGVPGGRDAYDYGGGAIYSQGGSVVVRRSTFVDNDANNGSGGAIHILQSGLVIEDSAFVNNSAIGARPEDSLGGAIYIDGLGGAGGLFLVVRSSFSQNRAYNSGGAIHVNMYENSSRTEISDSSFVGNAVVGGSRAQGGAIGGGGSQRWDNPGGSGNPLISIGGSYFEGNSVRRTAGAGGDEREDGSGGALAFPQRARLSIVNSSFVANRANGTSWNANGGALYVVNNSDQFEIVNSTFLNNSAGWVGGAISNSQISGGPGGLVRNTIFAGNSADNGPNDWNIQQHCSSELAHDGASLQYPPRLTGGSFWNDVTCFAGKSAPAQTGDPMFRDPKLVGQAANGGPTSTVAIAPDSPARDAGQGCPPVDQRGVTRPRGPACDIGAFELIVALEVEGGLVGVGASDRTMTVRGDGFGPTSVVRVGGAARPTSFVNSSTLRVTLSAEDVAAAGSLSLTVQGPGGGLGASSVRVVAGLRRVYLPLLD